MTFNVNVKMYSQVEETYLKICFEHHNLDQNLFNIL